ncbi:MAG: DUF948 domain-containing protein [Chlamydiia bacterium]|nr:DUF948 domain-containing protein [Chlamydiia bacterium]
MWESWIIDLSVAVIALAFVCLVIFCCVTLCSLARSMRQTKEAIRELEEHVVGLIDRSSDIVLDVHDKMNCLDPFVHLIKKFGRKIDCSKGARLGQTLSDMADWIFIGIDLWNTITKKGDK